jgi:hypothetical protein
MVEGRRVRAGESAKGVGAKFRTCCARFGGMVVLNFDPTPFARLLFDSPSDDLLVIAPKNVVHRTDGFFAHDRIDLIHIVEYAESLFE